MNPTKPVRQRIGPTPRESALSLDIPAGDEGARLTVAAMVAIVHAADRIGEEFDAFLRDSIGWTAAERPLSPPWRNREEHGLRVFDFLKRRFRFRKDPAGVEYLRTVDQMIEDYNKQTYIEGDCDERAILGAAMLRRLGYRAAFCLMARDVVIPFEHVYFGIIIDSARPEILPLDPQEMSRPFYEREAAKREWFTI